MKRGDIKCYRHICPGTMFLDSGKYYICDTCGISVMKESRLAHERGEIDLEDGDDFDGVPDYDPVYDEEGSEVPCEHCGTVLKYHDNKYVCPRCDRVMERKEFFEYIGAEPLGEKCYTCDDCYTYCKEYCDVYNEF